jgi:hypothetical protein
METIRAELVQNKANKVESIEARIAELEEYKTELLGMYENLKVKLAKKINHNSN